MAAKKAANPEKAKDTAVLREVASKAKAINVRLEKAAKMESDAFDHRLAAAIELGAVKEKLDKAKVSFKDWYAKNITATDKAGKVLSFETVRKLASAGMEKDPKAALEGVRAKNAKANKAHRAKQKEAQKALSAPAEAPAQRVLKGLDAMKTDERTKLVTEIARNSGLKVVEGSRDTDPGYAPVGLDSMKEAFKALKATDRMAFVQWAAAEIGMTVNNPFQSDSEGDGIPDFARRYEPKQETSRTRRKKAAA